MSLPNPSPIEVLLVDDHFVVRTGLASSLGLEGDIRVVGEASSVDEALDHCRAEAPDVVVAGACPAAMGSKAPERSGRWPLRSR